MTIHGVQITSGEIVFSLAFVVFALAFNSDYGHSRSVGPTSELSGLVTAFALLFDAGLLLGWFAAKIIQ